MGIISARFKLLGFAFGRARKGNQKLPVFLGESVLFWLYQHTSVIRIHQTCFLADWGVSDV